MSIEIQVEFILDLNFLIFYQILVVIYGIIILNPESPQMQFHDDKIQQSSIFVI